MSGSLYNRHNYLNKDIHYLFNKEIIEYDIESAGFNILKRYNLVDCTIIQKLENMSKINRHIYIGKLIKNNRELGKAINSKFIEIRKDFFEANCIQDEDILSIKKDAIFSFKRFTNIEFDNIIFREKNVYTSYYYLNNKEFYYCSYDANYAVKGISDNNLKLHEDYILQVLLYLFKILEVSSSAVFIKNLKEFAWHYKTKNLSIEYYRELSINSSYRLIDEIYGHKKIVYVDELTEDYLDIVDIGYNYMRYIVPMISIII